MPRQPSPTHHAVWRLAFSVSTVLAADLPDGSGMPHLGQFGASSDTCSPHSRHLINATWMTGPQRLSVCRMENEQPHAGALLRQPVHDVAADPAMQVELDSVGRETAR